MVALFEAVIGRLGGSDALVAVGERFDCTQDQAAAGIGAVVSALLGGLATSAASPGGDVRAAALVAETWERVDEPLLDLALVPVPVVASRRAEELVDRILGSARDPLVSGMARRSGLDAPAIEALLPALAPVVLETVADHRRAERLDPAALRTALVDERSRLVEDRLLDGEDTRSPRDDGPASAIDLRDAPRSDDPPDDAEAGIGPRVDSAGEAEVDVGVGDGARRGGVGVDAGVGDGAGRSVGGRGVVGVGDRAGRNAGAGLGGGGSARAEADRRPDGRTGAGRRAESAADAEPEVAPRRSAGRRGAVHPVAVMPGGAVRPGGGRVTAGRRPPSDAEEPGLGWLRWAVAAVILVLLLAWLLSTCTGTATEPRATTTSALPTTSPSETNSTATDSAATNSGTTDSRATNATGTDSTATDSRATNATATDPGAGSNTTTDPAAIGTTSPTTATTTATAPATGGATTSDGTSTTTDTTVAPTTTTAAPPASVGGPRTVNELLDLDPVTFEIRSAVITPEGRSVLDEVVAHLEVETGLELAIEGHTDDDGEAEANLALSRRRANAVRSYLIGQGIDARRLTAIGFGETRPAVANDSAEAKAVNRRIELVIR